MNSRPIRVLLHAVPFIGLLALGRPASAHDKWLEVEPPTAPASIPAKVYLVTGDALRQPELLPLRQRSRMTRFELVAASGRRDLLPALREDQQPVAVLPAGTLPAGTSLLRLDSDATDILLAAEKFQAYLFEERLTDILMQRASRGEEESPGRERYSRSMKAIVQIGPRLDEMILTPLGQELEIVPLAHPHRLTPGSRLAVRVLFRGQPLPGRAVTFANRFHAHVVTRTQRTDAQGVAAVPVERAGDWLICLVHMERSPEPGADWRSYWSSLSFTTR